MRPESSRKTEEGGIQLSRWSDWADPIRAQQQSHSDRLLIRLLGGSLVIMADLS